MCERNVASVHLKFIFIRGEKLKSGTSGHFKLFSCGAPTIKSLKKLEKKVRNKISIIKSRYAQCCTVSSPGLMRLGFQM